MVLKPVEECIDERFFVEEFVPRLILEVGSC